MREKNRIAAIAIVLVLALVLTGCAGLKDLLGGKDSWQEQYDLGMRYLDDGDYEEAILAFTAAIRIDDSRPEAYMARAEAYIAMDEPEKALKDYKKAMKVAKADDDYEDLVDELDELIEELEEWIEEQEDHWEEEGREDDWPLAEDWNPTENDAVQTTAYVTDVYSEYLVDCYGTECCYHIPQIHLEDNKAAAVNDTIYNDLSARLADNVSYTFADGSVLPRYSKILYTWGIHRDILSVMVVIRYADYEWTEFVPYNISMETGELISDAQLLAAYGLDEAGFREMGRAVLSEEVHSYSPEMIEAIGAEFYEYIVNSTLADDNLELAKPYVGPDGHLCMAACLYGAAGAGYYWHAYDLTEMGRVPAVVCEEDHFTQQPGANNHTPEEITQLVARWYNQNIGGYEYGNYVAFDQETWVSGNICNVVVRFQDTAPDYTGEANVLVTVAEVDMTTGAMWSDGYFRDYLW